MMPSFKNFTGHMGWPQDVGILFVELYFPMLYVNQTELETFDGVSQGKYTIGLGQNNMGFCTDREDVYSLCLTVVQSLLRRTGIAPTAIGRLEVGTETVVDKSKSIKTVLMQLFEESGNTEIEGVDVINACYGGTAALFNAIAWIESSAWDGRYALVVAADIAVYAKGNARCTGGAGAIAMLVGPNAPLVIERGLRGTHMQHVYDFYKPDLTSEYPFVDGKLSIQCYFAALDKCYERFKQKAKRKEEKEFSLASVDVVLFHSPYCKLVQKSLARLAFNDFLSCTRHTQKKSYPGLEGFSDLKLEETYFNREVEKAFMDFTRPIFQEKTEPSLLVAKEVGNMYTPSLYSCLASLICSKNSSELAGKRILVFSYGSGLASSMFSIRVSDNCSPGSELDQLCQSLAHIPSQLSKRRKASPFEFNKTMDLREKTHHQAPYIPEGSLDDLFTGTWYLTEVDEMHRRKYKFKSCMSDMLTEQNSLLTNALDSKITSLADGIQDGESSLEFVTRI